MLVVTGVMLEADKCLLSLEHLVALSAGPISHNSTHLLIITTDFVALSLVYWKSCFHDYFVSYQS